VPHALVLSRTFSQFFDRNSSLHPDKRAPLLSQSASSNEVDVSANASEDTIMSGRTPRNPSYTISLLPCLPWCRLPIALLLLLGGVMSANAQMGGGLMGGGHGGRQRNQQNAPQQPPAPPSPAAIPIPWPRLDSGAILCKSRDDLISFQTRAAGSSDSVTGSLPDCLINQTRTAIKILDRDGPSRSQVISTDSTKQTGWTNAYLPATPPAGVTTTATAGR
jgi:hypothetical protein